MAHAGSPTTTTKPPFKMDPREKHPRTCLSLELHGIIKHSRVLMVGAGGIGCELLKDLACTGFGEIHVVDLDTIDLSNLNRQFLFRQEHIKRSKAVVAKETACRFNPNVNIEAHHANIKDPQFDLDWFRQFKVVFNALDNLEARRHVNKMCLAADVPLVESGTTGFNGQVQVIKKGVSECYDCNQKETPKTFPVCTIRSTPSQPIHCIVWAKSYLFAELFGTSEDDSPELDNQETSDNAQEIEALKKERFALKRIRDTMGSEDFPRCVFEKVFADDIKRLRSMEDMWKGKRKPNALEFDALSHEAPAPDAAAIASQDQVVWTAAENLMVFCNSMRRLADRLKELRANKDVGNAAPVLSFDKDDRDTLDFVASASNLRSIVFGIDAKSEFDIKQMAGNIIPAIATTNAVTAGLCVLQAFKVLREQYDKARSVFLTKTIDRLLSSEALAPPKPDCPVCGICQSSLQADLDRATVKDLVEDILRGELAYGEDLSIRVGDNIIYDPDLEENLPRKLADFGVKRGGSLTVVDESTDEPRVDVVLWVRGKESATDEKPLALVEKFNIASKPPPAAEATTQSLPAVATTNGHTNGETKANGKRKRSADEEAGDIDARIVKKRGIVPDMRDGPIEVDEIDTSSGPIELD